MGLLAIVRGDAGNYRIKGAIWELGSFSYRAYVHLVPAASRLDLPRSVVSVGGATLQELLDATTARVTTTIGRPVEKLEVRAVLRNETRASVGPRRRGAAESLPA
jgi:hypothetical protein